MNAHMSRKLMVVAVGTAVTSLALVGFTAVNPGRRERVKSMAGKLPRPRRFIRKTTEVEVDIEAVEDTMNEVVEEIDAATAEALA